MRKKNSLVLLLPVLSIMFLAVGCKKEDPIPEKLKAETTYDLKAQDKLGVSGSVTFIETTSSSATINIKLTGASEGNYTAAIYMKSAIEGGEEDIKLDPVINGMSTTVITSKTYKDLIAYDGHIKVTNPRLVQADEILAIGDIGGNKLTSDSKTYSLKTANNSGITANALFQKRENGTTLLTITVTGQLPSGSYPASINNGSSTNPGGGELKLTLNPISSSTSKSITNVRTLDNVKFPVKYDDWMIYVGYINIYQKSIDIDNIICQGDIGRN